MTRASAALVLAFLLLSPAVYGAEDGGRVSIDVQDADIRGLLAILSEASGYNIVAHGDVRGRVSMRLEDVHWRDALNAIARARGLYPLERGRVIMLVPDEKVRDVIGGP